MVSWIEKSLQNSGKVMNIKRAIVFYSIILQVIALQAQVKINGKVTDEKGNGIPGVNVYLKGTFDGAASNPEGIFSFVTKVSGNQVIVASMIGFQTLEQSLTLSAGDNLINLRLAEAYNALNAVVITAGTFEASDEHKAVVLRPLDIVTTASSGGDLYGALRSLPGTQQVGEDGRLFVRGGEAAETRSYMDGMLIASPYSSQVPDIPARGRFSPFMFSGTVFSTGGYSAEYGQAMSSALVLKTNGLAEKTETAVSLMSVGGGLAHTIRAENNSISASVDYTNLAPYFELVKQNMSYTTAPQGVSGTMSYRNKSKNGELLRVFGNVSSGNININYPDFDNPGKSVPIGISNNNYYFNTTYTGKLSSKTTWFSGLALASDIVKRDMNKDALDENEKSAHVRFVLNHSFSDRYRLKTGIETLLQSFDQNFFNAEVNESFKSRFYEKSFAAFAESEIAPSNSLAFRAGIRAEYSALLSSFNLAPRLSASFRTSANSQISVACGRFFQNPDKQILLYTDRIGFEYADHFILNYQYAAHDRVLRMELYFKNYKNLVRFENLYNPDPLSYTSAGSGYAKGFDIFWRDQKTVRVLDYWISYSYIDTKRLYRDFPVSVTPHFVSTHNFNIVGKYFVDNISTEFGATYTFSSGRPYNDPNASAFMNGKTKSYHDLSMNASYLTELFGQFTIIHLIVSNVMGTSQVFGYNFSAAPGSDGVFKSYAIVPASTRFIFAGIFISIDHPKQHIPK
jgi:hypothetical protein